MGGSSCVGIMELSNTPKFRRKYRSLGGPEVRIENPRGPGIAGSTRLRGLKSRISGMLCAFLLGRPISSRHESSFSLASSSHSGILQVTRETLRPAVAHKSCPGHCRRKRRDGESRDSVGGSVAPALSDRAGIRSRIQIESAQAWRIESAANAIDSRAVIRDSGSIVWLRA